MKRKQTTPGGISEQAIEGALEPLSPHFQSPADALSLLVAMNRTKNNFIVIEALAGCGKTAMLADFIVRTVASGEATMDNFLLLSFTRNATRVARLRLRDSGVRLNTHSPCSTRCPGS
jgi:hypothetical protein